MIKVILYFAILVAILFVFVYFALTLIENAIENRAEEMFDAYFERYCNEQYRHAIGSEIEKFYKENECFLICDEIKRRKENNKSEH